MSMSTMLKISLGAVVAAGAAVVAYKTSPAFAEKVGKAGGAIKDVFSKGAEKAAEAASTVTDAGAAAVETATAAS